MLIRAMRLGEGFKDLNETDIKDLFDVHFEELAREDLVEMKMNESENEENEQTNQSSLYSC
jgi:hypothetical protein